MSARRLRVDRRPLLDIASDVELFVGRESELARLRRSIDLGLNVAVVGEPGSGKTSVAAFVRQIWERLGLEAASILAYGLLTWSWQGAVTAFFWASLVRVSLLHHVTWSINSICHTIGERPFVSRDKSANVWWLAIPSMGESWHNLHHADPTCARHGVLRGQIDISARVIWFFERLGWARDVKWPDPVRLAAKRRSAAPVPS